MRNLRERRAVGHPSTDGRVANRGDDPSIGRRSAAPGTGRSVRRPSAAREPSISSAPRQCNDRTQVHRGGCCRRDQAIAGLPRHAQGVGDRNARRRPAPKVPALRTLARHAQQGGISNKPVHAARQPTVEWTAEAATAGSRIVCATGGRPIRDQRGGLLPGCG